DTQMEAALVGEARREMIALAAQNADAELAEAFATVLQVAGESGLDALLGAIVSQRDGLRAFLGQISIGDGQFLPLFEEFGFNGTETAATLSRAILPDSYFPPDLVRGIASRAAAADKSI